MKGFIYRPLDSGAVYLRGMARRLAAKLGRVRGVKIEIHDGYVLRAASNDKSVVVTAIDPPALWLFLHQAIVTGFGIHRMLGTRYLTRDQLRPGETPSAEDQPARDKSADTALLPWVPGQGYYNAVDYSALFLPTNAASLARVEADDVTVAVMLRESNGLPALFSSRFQLLVDCFSDYQPKVYAPGADTTEFTGYYHRMRGWVIPESGLQAITGDSNARYAVRQSDRYSYGIPPIGGFAACNGFASINDASLWRSDPIVVGAYVSQPNSSDAGGIDPATDPARLGISGVYMARLRRPQTVTASIYPLQLFQQFAQRMTFNPEPELVPALVTIEDVTRYAEHGIAGVGVCYTQTAEELAAPADGQGARGSMHLFYTSYCAQHVAPPPADPVLWWALQLKTKAPNGVVSQRTLAKGSSPPAPGEAVKGYVIGPQLAALGAEGVMGTSYEIAGGALVQSSVKLHHFGTDGLIRDAGLLAAGWYPFTPYLFNPASPSTGNGFGQSGQFVADIGDGKLAVLARNSIVAGGASYATWHLVLIEQATGEFIEARGEVGQALTTTYSAHISVVSPETTEGDVTIPAVLVATLGLTHRLSRDGGQTWVVLFTGFIGHPLYLGNQLHRISYGETL